MARTMGKKAFRSLTERPLYVAFARGLTFTWFASTLFWFWANWKQISLISSSIGVARWIAVWAAVWVCATGVLAAWERIRAALLSISFQDGPLLTSSYARVVYGAVLGLIAIMISVVMAQPAPDVVYKAF